MRKLLFWMLSLNLFLLSCNKDSESFTETVLTEEPIKEDIPMGTVSLKALVKNRIDVETDKVPVLEDILENLNIDIRQFGLFEILNAQYSDLPEFIELPAGSYEMILSSTGLPPFRFDTGRYGQDAIEFTIVSGENKVVDVTLSLMDVATTIDFSDEVLQNYPNIKASATMDYSDVGLVTPLEWTSLDDGRTVFFEILTKDFTSGTIFFQAATGDLIIDITALDSAGNEILVSKTYPNVLANQHYKIIVRYSGSSTVSLNISLGDEDVIEDEISFPNYDDTNHSLAPGDLIISEVMSNPSAVPDAEGEWFEIYNTTNATISLKDIKFSGESKEFIIQEDVVVPPNSYFVFGANKDETLNGGIPMDYEYNDFQLSNSTTIIRIFEGDTEIDVFSLAASSTSIESGKALNQAPSSYNNLENESDVWCNASNQLPSGDFGSPGQANNECD